MSSAAIHRATRVRARLASVFAIAAALLGVVACAGCSQNPFASTTVEEAQSARLAAREPELAAPDIVEDGKLTVGLVVSEGAPSVIETSGGYAGIDVDVAAALAQELGLDVKFVPLTNSATMALAKVDVVMGVSTAETGGLVVASDYMESAIGFFTLGDEPTVLSASEIDGQTVGLQSASASQQLLAASNLTMTETGFSNIDEAMDALAAGTVQYVLCPVYPGAFLANEMGGISFCGTLNVPTTEGVGVAASATNLAQAVQSAMDDIRDNGVLAVILSKWVGDLPRLTAESQITGVALADATQTQLQATTPGAPGGNAATGDDLPTGSATTDGTGASGTTGEEGAEDADAGGAGDQDAQDADAGEDAGA